LEIVGEVGKVGKSWRLLEIVGEVGKIGKVGHSSKQRSLLWRKNNLLGCGKPARAAEPDRFSFAGLYENR